MEFYRHDKEELAEARAKDPFPKLKQALKDDFGVKDFEILAIEGKAKKVVAKDYELALKEEDPRPAEEQKKVLKILL